jgi:hypothetical protein
VFKLGRHELLDVLAADAGHRCGYALTGEERAVIGVGADGPGRQVGHLQAQSPRRPKYGKLSYAGTGICLSYTDR